MAGSFLAPRLLLESCPVVELSSGGMTLRRRDFDAVCYMGVHNRSGGNPHPRVIQALALSKASKKRIFYENILHSFIVRCKTGCMTDLTVVCANF